MATRLLLVVAAALVVAPAPTGAVAAGTACGSGGVTRYAKQGVRLYSVKTTINGKARVRLLACSKLRPRPKVLAYGPASVVKFGAFHTSGRYVGFEVVGVQSSAGEAGPGTNHNIGWVDARSGAIRMNFLWVSRVRWPRHAYAIDAASGSLVALVGAPGHDQTLLEADYDRSREDFVGEDVSDLDGAWDLLYPEGAGKITLTSLRFVAGKIHYRTTDGRRITLDPHYG